MKDMKDINIEQEFDQEFECLCGNKFLSTEWYYPYKHTDKIIAEICPECTITVEKKI